MRHLLLALILASCASPDRPAEPVPAPGPEAPPPTAPAVADPAATMPLSLRAKFEPVGPDVLWVAPPTSLEDDGPLVGNELGREDYEYLDEQLQSMAGYEELHACLELEDGFFVLRGPGADGPTDLFLAQWQPRPRVLAWVADLAFSHCGEEGCSVQQSWLVDLDGDGRRDVVRRGRIEDAATGEIEDTFEAWIISPDGVLRPTDLPAADRSRFRLEG